MQIIAIFTNSILTLLSVTAELHIRKSGIQQIDRLDVGMVFFIEIVNEGEHPIALGTRMINCCENVTPEDIDCEHIQLIGGDMGVLNPHGTRNLTLVWPTLYLHERKGECNIAISYGCRNNQTGEIQEKVRFDTSVSNRKVPAVLEGYYEPMIVKKCQSVDLDPLDHCRPINCHIKYNGRRNFYNRKLQRCQPVPICIADTGKELPDVAYVPVSNTCRDLENAVNEMEIRALSRGEAEPAWGSEPAPRMVIAALLGTLVVFFCCAMAFMVRGFMPPGPTVDCGQQTGGLTCFDSSRKSVSYSSPCDNKKCPKMKDRRSSTSCPGLR